jgi:Uma2 family endonuclease
VNELAYASVAPDWICEVLSPGTYRLDRVKKLAAYARAGVSHAWLVNPSERTLEILRRQRARWVIVATHGGDTIVRAEPFEAVAIDLLELWGETRAPRSPPSPAKKKRAAKTRRARGLTRR